MANSVFMKAEEVQEMLGVSRSESYRIIKKLNDDLKAKGFLFHGYSTTVVSVGDVGRLGASGLLGICTRVTAANVRPGDLIFFEGTYDTTGASHVGIYVGNNMMIHCGDVRPDRTEVEVDERRTA